MRAGAAAAATVSINTFTGRFGRPWTASRSLNHISQRLGKPTHFLERVVVRNQNAGIERFSECFNLFELFMKIFEACDLQGMFVLITER